MKNEKLTPKKKLGFILLIIVISCWIAAPILPFFDFPHKAIMITTVLIGGEILFVITIALLGKEYWDKIKKSFLRIFTTQKKKTTDEQTEETEEARREDKKPE